jgi:xylulokinase
MYLGLDIGTSAVKAILMESRGAVADQGSAALEISRPQTLWSEQDPADWWKAVNLAVQKLDARLRAQTRAIGLSGQMHGATILGFDDKVLRPAILWNDGRSATECTEIEEAVPDSMRITGNRAMPGFTAPKILWLQKAEPAVHAKIARVLLPKDYVRLLMTGDAASDMSDSAGTLWMDVGRREWSDRMLAATGLDRSAMPRLFEGNAITGQLRESVAQDWGMARIPVAAGGGDNAAGAVGVGVINAGNALLSLGTSGVLFVANDGFEPNAAGGVHSFCHALPDRWHQMSVILSAASALDWVARLTGLGSAADATEAAQSRSADITDEMFLPYLSGERTPHNDPAAKGIFYGLTHDTDPAALVQAVLEGVAFAFRDGLDALSASGKQPELITVIGGGSRSAYWGQILAAALNRPLAYRDGAETGPALGAARLAQLATGDGDTGSVCSPPPVSHIIEPDPYLAEKFGRKQEAFRLLYQRLKPSFQEHI